MPADTNLELQAGQIVLADWRGDARPKEANKLRPAIVVEEDGLFAPNYPNVLLVPLTEDSTLAIPDLAVAIRPSPENGCAKFCWALSHLVTATSKARVRPTASRVTPEQLVRVRRQIGFILGVAF
jgi:mRNA interferase MazF